MTLSKNKKQMVYWYADTGYTSICDVCGCRHGKGPTGPRELRYERCEKHAGVAIGYYAGIISAAKTERNRRQRHRAKSMGDAGRQA